MDFVEKWYIEGYRKDLHDWLRMPLLELCEASCLLFGRNPDRLSFDVERPDGADWDNNLPGIETRFTFYELARRAVFSGELEGREDSCGRIFVTPAKVFEFAIKRGLKMKSSLRLVWSEAIAEQASIAEGKTHEQSEHPSEEWITNKEAAQLLTNSLSGLSDGAAKTCITEARISNKIKGKKKDSGHGYLVEKASVMYFLKKLKDARSNDYDAYQVRG